MWTDIELKQLESTLEDVELDHILTEEEIEIIKQNSTRYNSLKSEIIVPKHTKEVEYYRIISYDNLLRLKQYK